MPRGSRQVRSKACGGVGSSGSSQETDDACAKAGVAKVAELGVDVVAENQIRLVVRTFRDKLPEIFPGRTEVPKTLVFAKTDLHAEDIVRIISDPDYAYTLQPQKVLKTAQFMAKVGSIKQSPGTVGRLRC